MRLKGRGQIKGKSRGQKWFDQLNRRIVISENRKAYVSIHPEKYHTRIGKTYMEYVLQKERARHAARNWNKREKAVLAHTSLKDLIK